MIHAVRPGVYRHLSNADYHAGAGTSKSGLDLIHQSAERFAYAKSHDSTERVSTPAQVFGTAYHAIVLEPETFYRTYTRGISMEDAPDAIDDRDVLVAMVQRLNEGRLPKLPTTGSKAEIIERLLRAGSEQGEEVTDATPAALARLKGADLKVEVERLNASRAGLLPVSGSRHDLADILRANGVAVTLWSDIKAEWDRNNVHRVVISDKDWSTLHAMRDKLMQHPAARRLLGRAGHAEMSFYWIDGDTGELLRCRPDYYTECGFCLDLKTTNDASPSGFVYSVQSFRYDVQDPFYVDGIANAIEQSGIAMVKPRGFFFIAQEKEPPYSVGVYSLDAEDVEIGRMEYRADLRKLARCRATDTWGGYGDGVQSLSLKAWHRQEAAIAASEALQ